MNYKERLCKLLEFLTCDGKSAVSVRDQNILLNVADSLRTNTGYEYAAERICIGAFMRSGFEGLCKFTEKDPKICAACWEKALKNCERDHKDADVSIKLPVSREIIEEKKAAEEKLSITISDAEIVSKTSPAPVRPETGYNKLYKTGLSPEEITKILDAIGWNKSRNPEVFIKSLKS